MIGPELLPDQIAGRGTSYPLLDIARMPRSST